MIFAMRFGACWVFLAGHAAIADAREWTDASGEMVMEAELFGMNDEHVVLKRTDGELGVLAIEQLSESDREFLASDAARTIHDQNVHLEERWTTASGIVLEGRIVDFAARPITVQRRRGRVYVDDRRRSNLPDFYQRLVVEIIEHFDRVDLPDERAMQRWIRDQRGRPRTFALEGVILETDSGDEYAIPFFVFSADDQELLMAGWPDWLQQQDDFDLRDDLAFRLESLAAAHLANQELQREIALIDLKLQAVRSGLTSLWEVTLYPDFGHRHPPMWVVVPGRNSEQAATAALAANPGFVVGPVRRVSR